jgi:hypothetical protein
MSRFISDFWHVAVDDVLADGLTEFWQEAGKVGDKTLVSRFKNSAFLEETKKIAGTKIPLPGLSVGTGALLDGAAQIFVNSTVGRFIVTAGLIGGIALAIGYTPVIAATAIGVTYGIKVASSYGFLAGKRAVEWGWHKVRGKKEHNEKRHLSPKHKVKLSSRAKLLAAGRHILHAAFGSTSQNTGMNLVDIALTVTSGVLLMPTTAGAMQWLGGLLSTRPERLILRQGLIRNAMMPASVQTSAVEASEVSSGYFGRIGRQVLESAGERVSSIAAQGTMRSLGRKFIKDHQNVIESAIAGGVAASAMIGADDIFDREPAQLKIQTVGNTVLDTNLKWNIIYPQNVSRDSQIHIYSSAPPVHNRLMERIREIERAR